mgnify:CR=1 FL=1
MQKNPPVASGGFFPNELVSQPSRVELTGILSKLAPPLHRMVSTHQLIRQRPLPRNPRRRQETLHHPPLSEAKLVTAEARYQAGATLNSIAVDLGISRQSLSSQLRRRGVQLRGRTPDSDAIMEMRRRYESGQSLERVGSRLGFSAGTVRTHLLGAGVQMRDCHGRTR